MAPNLKLESQNVLNSCTVSFNFKNLLWLLAFSILFREYSISFRLGNIFDSVLVNK